MNKATTIYNCLQEILDMIIYINEVSKMTGDKDELLEQVHSSSIQLEETFVYLKRILEGRKP